MRWFDGVLDVAAGAAVGLGLVMFVWLIGGGFCGC